MTQFNTNFNGTLPFTNKGASLFLAASTALPYTVPGTPNMQYRAEFPFTIGQNIWVALNATAVLPTSGAATATAYQELLGPNTVRYVKGGDVLSFISTGTPQIGVNLWLVQQT